MATSHSSLLEPRTVGVFDVETTLDAAAAGTAGYKGAGLPPALLRIATACIFEATERPDGSWTDFTLHTFADPLSEFDVLMALDRCFADLDGRGALLATYNGRKHDLAVLRRRAARYWMFGLPGIAAAATMDHVDIMLRQQLGRRDAPPSLRDACAGLGINAFDPRKPSGTRTPSASAPAPDVRKCQTDVVATFLLALYEMAVERGSPDVLLRGWQGLSAHLSQPARKASHLEHFRNHPLLRAAERSIATDASDDDDTM